jgi:GNAT superfamily N-acetyltransferase
VSRDGPLSLRVPAEAFASLDLVADHVLDTAAQRSATGLDRGARELILRAVDNAGAPPDAVLACLFVDRFGSLDDYYAAVEDVWGYGTRRMCEAAKTEAELNGEFALNYLRRRDAQRAGLYALLLTMPEPDFRLAVQLAARSLGVGDALANRITNVCRSRGAPWAFSASGFEWVGDEVVEREMLRPALATLNDPRLAAGARIEFESARAELRIGTPAALGQAVVESAKAVESAMRVLLEDRGIAYAPGDAAQKLFNRLESAGVLEHYMERTVLASATPRNKVAAHGGGAVAHVVTVEQAEAIVAAAAGAITYLGKLLKPLPARRTLLARLGRR